MQIWSNRGTLSHTLAANLHQYGFDIKAGWAVFYAPAEKSFRAERVEILCSTVIVRFSVLSVRSHFCFRASGKS